MFEGGSKIFKSEAVEWLLVEAEEALLQIDLVLVRNRSAIDALA